MKRIVKFKIWDKLNLCWYKPIYDASNWKLEDILINPFNGFLLMRDINNNLDATDKIQDRFELLQFSWLKDKNWEEIYHYDVISDWEKNYICAYDDDNARFWFRPPFWWMFNHPLKDMDEISNYVIVWNILILS